MDPVSVSVSVVTFGYYFYAMYNNIKKTYLATAIIQNRGDTLRTWAQFDSTDPKAQLKGECH